MIRFTTHIRRITFMALGALLLTGAVAWSANESRQGTIASMEASTVVLSTHAEELTFNINSSTQISLDGKPAKATDLNAGDTATILYAAQDDNLPLAIRIMAQRNEAPDNPDPVPFR